MNRARVNTTSGPVEGRLSADGAIASFKGIPYAEPPIGPLRWAPPRRPVRWSGRRTAYEFGAASIQPLLPDKALFYSAVVKTSEDCLYLNVFSEALGRSERRAVLVWMHYGGFLFGWSGAPLYDGEALARQGVVVVTINYRLGRLGFLAHPALSAEGSIYASGNFGLQDQIRALEWVRENIAEFGGDPGCVTVYGVSAGSYSVSALMSSPSAKGLFHRAIAGSGAAFGPLADSTEGGDFCQTLTGAERVGVSLMSELGAHTADDMRKLSPETVLQVRPADFSKVRRGVLDSTYPIIDGKLLLEDPYTTFQRGNQNDVPLLTGSNAHESGIFNSDTDTFVADYRSFLEADYDRFAALYPAGAAGLTLRSSKAASADRLFSWQNWAWANAHAQTGTQPVFYYHFAHEPPIPTNTFLDQAIEPSLGAHHTAELYYSFRNLHVREWPWTEIDRAMADTVSAYWLAFMRSGNPNNRACPKWPAFQQATPTMMLFDGNNTGMTKAPSSSLAHRLSFWEAVYSKSRVTVGGRKAPSKS